MNKLKLGLMMLVVLMFGGAMAQTQVGQPQPAALPALQTLVLPAGVELSDEELAQVEGLSGPLAIPKYVVGSTAMGAFAGATAQAYGCAMDGCSARQAAERIVAGGLAGAMTGFKGGVIKVYATVGQFALQAFNVFQGIVLQDGIGRR